jgi:hypothetical protein
LKICRSCPAWGVGGFRLVDVGLNISSNFERINIFQKIQRRKRETREEIKKEERN